MKEQIRAEPHPRAHLLAAAGLLHDVGKVLQPAEIPLSQKVSNLQAMICPTDPKTQKSTHQHAIYTAAALDAATTNFGGLDAEEIFRVACYHHRPNPESLDQQILTKADWLASGHDQRDAEESMDWITGLAPVLSGVRWPLSEPTQSHADQWLPTNRLSFARSDFLPGSGQSRDAYRESCRGLADDLMAGLQQQFVDPSECVDSLLSLTERVMHAVPASRSRSQHPDVTLFDHSRLVAAFAACLGVQHQGDVQEAGKIRGAFRLVGVGLGGIQKFLFRVVPVLDERDGDEKAGPAVDSAGGMSGAKGMAKRLRARSLYVSLLSWLAARRILDALGLPSTNLISNAGGRAVLLLPDTPECAQTCDLAMARIDQWFSEQVGGILRLDLAVLDGLTDDDFTGANFPETFRRLDRELAAARLRLPAIGLQNESGWSTDGWILREQQGDFSLPIDRGTFNRQLARFGSQLPKARYLTIGSHDRGSAPWIEILGYHVQVHAEKPNTGRSFSLDIDEADLTTPLWIVANHVPVADEVALQRWGRSRVIGEDRDDAAGTVGELLTFEQLAALASNSQGVPIEHAMLGALKADVDHLGMIMGYGLDAQVSFGRYVSVARSLDLFFKGMLTHELRENYRHIYTIFAGGDDLFLVGPWYDLVRLLSDLRRWFQQLVCVNQCLHFSAGLVFASPRTPVQHLGHLGEEALEQAKSQGRNRVTVCGVTLPWDQFDRALALHHQLVAELSADGDQKASLNRSLVYRLLQYGKQGRGHHPGRDRPSPTDLKWRAQLSYDLKRNFPAPSEHRPSLLKLREALQMILTPQDAAVLEVASSLTLYFFRGDS
jgi:CRISPR-associated protein Csm1